MISLEVARKLKDAGLVWRPKHHDFFGIPDRGMDDAVFVLSDVQVTIERIQGYEVVAFQGASEWALDSLIASEAIWLPTEEQLHLILEEKLLSIGQSDFRLSGGISGYTCEIMIRERIKRFDGATACDVYAAAVLFFLNKELNKDRS